MKIALDIDDMLATSDGARIRERSPNPDPVHMGADRFMTVRFQYQEQQVTFEHFLFPGCIEMIQALLDLKDCRVAVFSSGVEARNKVFAAELGKKAVAHGSPASVRRRLGYYSRENCFDTERFGHESRELQAMFQPQYTNFRGNYKKDLRVLAWGKKRYAERFSSSLRNPPLLFPNPKRDQRLLADVLLIEEDVSYVFPGQERNLLKTPTLSSYMYNNLRSWESEELPPLTGNRMEDQNFMAINTLFYATGMLMHIIVKSQASGKGLADTAWEEQLRLGIIETGDECPVPDSRKWARYTPKIEFYLKGRDILRTYNPALNFAVAGQPA